jgi:hypothetical protein
MGDLSSLTRDLTSPTVRRSKTKVPRFLITTFVLIAAAVSAGLIVEHSGTPGTLATTSQSTGSSSGGFVQPQPSLAGKFCQGVLASPGNLGTGPTSDPWGTQTIIVPTHPSKTYVQDFATVQSLENATSVVQMAWQKNGYQFAKLTVKCLSAYDSHFRWISGGDSSSGAGVISVSYADRHSLLAAKSDSGTCWYELNVMGPGDPVIAQDDLQSYGVFFTKGGASCTANGVPSLSDWELADPLPPQLNPS